MKQSVYARNYESLMEAEVAKRPGMHSHGGPWERGFCDTLGTVGTRGKQPLKVNRKSIR